MSSSHSSLNTVPVVSQTKLYIPHLERAELVLGIFNNDIIQDHLRLIFSSREEMLAMGNRIENTKNRFNGDGLFTQLRVDSNERAMMLKVNLPENNKHGVIEELLRIYPAPTVDEEEKSANITPVIIHSGFLVKASHVVSAEFHLHQGVPQIDSFKMKFDTCENMQSFVKQLQENNHLAGKLIYDEFELAASVNLRVRFEMSQREICIFDLMQEFIVNTEALAYQNQEKVNPLPVEHSNDFDDDSSDSSNYSNLDDLIMDLNSDDETASFDRTQPLFLNSDVSIPNPPNAIVNSSPQNAGSELSKTDQLFAAFIEAYGPREVRLPWAGTLNRLLATHSEQSDSIKADNGIVNVSQPEVAHLGEETVVISAKNAKESIIPGGAKVDSSDAVSSVTNSNADVSSDVSVSSIVNPNVAVSAQANANANANAKYTDSWSLARNSDVMVALNPDEAARLGLGSEVISVVSGMSTSPLIDVVTIGSPHFPGITHTSVAPFTFRSSKSADLHFNAGQGAALSHDNVPQDPVITPKNANPISLNNDNHGDNAFEGAAQSHQQIEALGVPFVPPQPIVITMPPKQTNRLMRALEIALVVVGVIALASGIASAAGFGIFAMIGFSAAAAEAITLPAIIGGAVSILFGGASWRVQSRHEERKWELAAIHHSQIVQGPLVVATSSEAPKNIGNPALNPAMKPVPQPMASQGNLSSQSPNDSEVKSHSQPIAPLSAHDEIGAQSTVSILHSLQADPTSVNASITPHNVINVGPNIQHDPVSLSPGNDFYGAPPKIHLSTHEELFGPSPFAMQSSSNNTWTHSTNRSTLHGSSANSSAMNGGAEAGSMAAHHSAEMNSDAAIANNNLAMAAFMATHHNIFGF